MSDSRDMGEAESPRQTRSFLMKRFAEAGIHPKTRFGQNFLIDLNLLHVLFEAGQVGPNDVVLEVGGGTGALTALLASRAAHVVSVEIDRQLQHLATYSLHGTKNVTFLLQDALKNKGNMNPRVLDELAVHLDQDPTRRLKLVSNLPYHVSTPILSNLLAGNPRFIPDTMTVTLQKELADRIGAPPRTKDYSHLSIWIQCQCDVELVRSIPPQAFWPRPKIDSAIVHVRFRPDLRARLPDPAFFHTFVRALFFHRRKFLRGVLLSAFRGRLEKSQVDEVLGQLAYGPTARAEELDIATLIQLSEAFRTKLIEVGAAALPPPIAESEEEISESEPDADE